MITLEDATVVSWPEGNKKPKASQLHGTSGVGRDKRRLLGLPDRGDLLRALPR